MKIEDKKYEWLKSETERIVVHARIKIDAGVEILTPAVGGYQGLWARDLEYAAKNTPEYMDEALLRQCYLRLLSQQRDDGAIPVAITVGGGPHFLCWGNRKFTDADTAQYAVKLAGDYYSMTGELDLFSQTAETLIGGMNFMPRSENGLIWIDPDDPHTAYGFTDSVVKTGNVLFSSLLYWEASLKLAQMLEKIERTEDAEGFRSRAGLIEANLGTLWDDTMGVFMAASQVGRQIDIWGNAYAVYIGLASQEQRSRICQFLTENYNRYIFNGQVRHLLEGNFWERTWHPDTTTVPRGEYQNGAYWGTASGWIGYAVAQIDRELAVRHFTELINYYQTHGAYECVGHDGVGKMRDYVASVVNPLGALKRLVAETEN